MAGANDPWPLWAQEAAGTSGGPTIARVLAVGALVAALALLVPVADPATHSGQGSNPRQLSPACAELARLRAHGVATGGQVARLRVACSRSTGR